MNNQVAVGTRDRPTRRVNSLRALSYSSNNFGANTRSGQTQGLVLSLITAFVWFANDILLGLRDYLGCFLGGAAAGVTVLITGPFTRTFGLNAPSAVGIAASASAPALMGRFFARDYSRLRPAVAAVD